MTLIHNKDNVKEHPLFLLAEAFTKEGVPLQYSHDGVIWLPQVMKKRGLGYVCIDDLSENNPTRVLFRQSQDLQDDLVLATNGKVSAYQSVISVVATEPRIAIEEKNAVINLLLNANGYLSKRVSSPVTINGIKVFKFEPDDGIISEEAQFWEFVKDTGKGAWVCEQRLRIVLKN
jgi:hypothetical protein